MFVIAQIVGRYLKRHVRTDNNPWVAIDHRLRTLIKPYLNYVCQDFLNKFHNDFAEFHWNRSKNLRGEFIFSEEQDYKSLYRLLKLHDFTSFILPEKIAEEDKQTVVNQYLFD